MEKQEFLDLITSIGTCEDEVQRRESLATLSEKASELFDANAKFTEDNKNLTTKNNELQEANMKLFLRVGVIPEPNVPDNNHGNDSEPKKMTYDDLFDENGGLK